jgi:2,3-bisphosphoglycerate-independent phosphoglycerate mutase
MTSHLDLVSGLAQKNDRKMILLVMDGVGGIHTEDSPRTALERANTPHLDALARRSALGRSLPTDQGITPGSGPGHLGLFGYDSRLPNHQIGRGVLEALGINYELQHGEVAARGNFCTLGPDGKITDRRAGRPSNEECERLSALLDQAIGQIEDVKVRVLPVREHRFCVIFIGDALDPDLQDTDPQRVGFEPLPAMPKSGDGDARTLRVVQSFLDQARLALRNEPQANGLTLRGFSAHPGLPTFDELYHLTPAAVAAYPLYRGVARLAGMEILETGTTPAEQFATVAENWDRFDYFFIHIKKTDSSGEDGDLNAKTRVIEQVDAALPTLRDLNPDVMAIVGDHCTPAPMKGHSWHPVPLLLHGPFCDIDTTERYTESETLKGSLGTIPADRLLGLMLANAGKLAKYGA